MNCFIMENILIYNEEFFSFRVASKFPTLSVQVLVLLCMFLSPAHKQAYSMDIDKDIDKGIEIIPSAQLGLQFALYFWLLYTKTSYPLVSFRYFVTEHFTRVNFLLILNPSAKLSFPSKSTSKYMSL